MVKITKGRPNQDIEKKSLKETHVKTQGNTDKNMAKQ